MYKYLILLPLLTGCVRGDELAAKILISQCDPMTIKIASTSQKITIECIVKND